MDRFLLPDYSVAAGAYGDRDPYAIRNYYGRSPIAFIKRSRFRTALKMGSRVGASGVIDMGCADGILIPSLSRQYSRVAAIDSDESFVTTADRLTKALDLGNVRVLCNAGLTQEEVAARIGTGFRLMFLLETLEHIGRQPDIWASKIEFLRGCFSLLDDGGQIVISVPKMVGMVVLVKNVLQRSLGLGHDALTAKQLLRSAFLKDTDELEKRWRGHHVGFNHLKLDKHLAREFVVHERVESIISVFYRIGLVPGESNRSELKRAGGTP